MFKRIKQCFIQRGQVAVFYALMIPVFLFVCGVGLDLGWYYLNVSRLQNAADAAVLGGANELVKEHDLFKNKYYHVKLVAKYPPDNPVPISTDTKSSDVVALDYAKKNLEGDSTAYAPPSLFSVAQAEPYTFKDGYTRGDPEVKMTTFLYKEGNNYYYVVHLTENIHHFFIGFLDDMEAPVVAVAKLAKDNVKQIIFKANGGTFHFGGKEISDYDTPVKEVLINATTATIKLPAGYDMSRESFTFKRVWTKIPDGSGNSYDDGKTLSEDELDDLFEGSDTVILYAQWVPKTPEEIEGLSIYAAMKGNKE